MTAMGHSKGCRSTVCGRSYGEGSGHDYIPAFRSGAGQGVGHNAGQSKCDISVFTCMKFFFFGFNVVFWLLGCAILGIGIWLHISKGAYASLAPSFNFLSATTLCIFIGIVILVIGFFGCCGAIMESQCLLVSYFLLVVFIFLLESLGGVLAFVYRDDVEEMIRQELYTGIQTKYPTPGDPDASHSEEGLKIAWAFIQSSLECCGVHNYTDWHDISAWPGRKYVPRDCCRNASIPKCNVDEDQTLIYTKGCLNRVKMEFNRNFYLFMTIGIIVGVIQVLSMVASMSLCCCLRTELYWSRVETTMHM